MFHRLSIPKALPTLITKFGVVGLLSVAVYFLCLFLLENVIENTIVLTATCYLISMAFNYICQSTFTFETSPDSKSQTLRYIAMQLFCMAVNSGLMYGLVDLFGLNLFLSQVFTTGAVAALSFILSVCWVYRRT